MKFTNAFEVSLPPEQAWPFLLDVESIVPCMPGAELIEKIDDRNFKGKISVRLGPVALTFVCVAVFEEIDNEALRARIKAQGTDPKGRGGANSVIDLHLEPSEKGSKVVVDTDLTMTGSVAQYGRGAGMIQSVANQIVSQFSKNLEEQIGLRKQVVTPEASVPPVAPMGATPDAPAADTQVAGPKIAPPPPRAPAKPISGFSLVFASLVGAIRGLFTRKS